MSCLDKMYLLIKIQNRLHDVPGCLVILNCSTPTEKLSEFLDHHLKPIIKAGKSYIEDARDILENLKNVGNISSNAMLVSVDVLGLHSSIFQGIGLQDLYEILEEKTDKKTSPTDLAVFILKNNFFEFDTNIFHFLE